MDSSTFIAIYIPLFIIFIIVIPNGKKALFTVLRMKRRKRRKVMANELIKSCIGKLCTITTGSLGSSYSKVVILEVVDNWIKVESKNKIDLINIDFIQNIKIHNK